MNRRRFLLSLSATALTAACRPAGVAPPTAYQPGIATAVRLTSIPPGAVSISAAPTTEALQTPITPVARLYEKSFRLTPERAKLDGLTLTLDGLTERALTLTPADLRDMPQTESMQALECISNPTGGALIGNMIWGGVAFERLFKQATVKPECKYVWFEAADGYYTSVERRWLEQPGVLLIHSANGEPLPPEHGWPLRLLIPGLYGQKMPKWITRITFAAEDRIGYWEHDARGWSNLATVKTNSAITTPERKFTLGSVIRFGGWAYAGARAIANVEVGIGVGNTEPARWDAATVAKPPSVLAWTWWQFDWQPTQPGDYRVALRATDSKGYTQSIPARGTLAGAYPDGTDAIHAIGVQVI